MIEIHVLLIMLFFSPQKRIQIKIRTGQMWETAEGSFKQVRKKIVAKKITDKF